MLSGCTRGVGISFSIGLFDYWVLEGKKNQSELHWCLTVLLGLCEHMLDFCRLLTDHLLIWVHSISVQLTDKFER